MNVDYTTSDRSEVIASEAEAVALCGMLNGTALSKCDFNTALGTLRFAAGETTKTFTILLTDDSYIEGPESAPLTLSNPTGGAVLGTQRTASLLILDDAIEPTANAILDARNFVRQQYHEFLNREPDGPGWDFWTANITQCSDPAKRPAGQSEAQCVEKQRVTTSGAFFLSPEFQYTGFYVYRAYTGALGRTPTFIEFMRDAQQVGVGIVVNNQLSGAVINQNKAVLAAQVVQRAEFRAIYDGLNNLQYVDKLFQTTGINASVSDRQVLVDGLNNGSETRATALVKVVDGILVVSEGNQQFTTTYGKAFYDQEFNPAFVQMQYWGYLRRNSDTPGYQFWLGKLNFFGNYLDAEMVRSFIVSPEYRSRFGQP